MKTIGIIHGPNLNKLGKREQSQYGSFTLENLESTLSKKADELACELKFFQSNHEGELIEKLHEWGEKHLDGLIVNFGGLSHTSISLRDAIEYTKIPCIEVHISNIHARESFRHSLITASACKGCIAGFGQEGYLMALSYLIPTPDKKP